MSTRFQSKQCPCLVWQGFSTVNEKMHSSFAQQGQTAQVTCRNRAEQCWDTACAPLHRCLLRLLCPGLTSWKRNLRQLALILGEENMGVGWGRSLLSLWNFSAKQRQVPPAQSGIFWRESAPSWSSRDRRGELGLGWPWWLQHATGAGGLQRCWIYLLSSWLFLSSFAACLCDPDGEILSVLQSCWLIQAG